MKRDFLGGDPPNGRPPWRRGDEGDAKRLARDLHDGPLQLLGGMTLQVHALRQVAEAGAVRDRLAGLQRQLVQVQRDLRRHVERLSRTPRPTRTGGPAADRMGAFGALLSGQWGVPVRAQAAYLEDPPPELEHAVLRLVSEAVADGVRLLGVRSVSVDLKAGKDGLRLKIVHGGAEAGATEPAVAEKARQRA